MPILAHLVLRFSDIKRSVYIKAQVRVFLIERRIANMITAQIEASERAAEFR